MPRVRQTDQRAHLLLTQPQVPVTQHHVAAAPPHVILSSSSDLAPIFDLNFDNWVFVYVTKPLSLSCQFSQGSMSLGHDPRRKVLLPGSVFLLRTLTPSQLHSPTLLDSWTLHQCSRFSFLSTDFQGSVPSLILTSDPFTLLCRSASAYCRSIWRFLDRYPSSLSSLFPGFLGPRLGSDASQTTPRRPLLPVTQGGREKEQAAMGLLKVLGAMLDTLQTAFNVVDSFPFFSTEI